MAPRKRSQNPAARKKKRAARGWLPQSTAVRAIISLAVLVFVVMIISVTAEYLLARKMPADTTGRLVVLPGPHVESVSKIPIYEIFPPAEVHPVINNETPPPPPAAPESNLPKPSEKPEIVTGHPLPRVVIIIDDIGYNTKIVDQFLSLDLPITFSVLPFSPHQRRIVKTLQTQDREIMLHLPMEPVEYPRIDPGPGALLTSMSPAELTHHLEKALNAIPQAIGVNNHMGSRLTVDAKQMSLILSVIKQRHLFFIDSRTANKNVTRHLAKGLRLPYAQRTVFLDNNLSVPLIRKQLRELLYLAGKRGGAIGIGHPHMETFEALSQELHRLKTDIQLVPASQLVHIIG